VGDDIGGAGRSDTELVAMAVDGDLQAFGAIVRRYQGLVHASALRQSGNAADAQDVAQEVFLAAFQSLNTLREPEKLPGWLRSMVRNTWCSWQRRRRLSASVTEDHLRAGTIQGGMALPDEHVQQRELRERVLAAVSALPQSAAEAVSLHYVDGYSCNDIATRLSVSATTVKGRLQMGRELLRKALAEMMEDSPVRELLGRASEAASRMGRDKAHGLELTEPLDLVEQALARAADLRTAQERETARMHALVAKADYLQNSEDVYQEELRREALKLARRHREHGVIAHLLVQLTIWAHGRDSGREQVLAEAADEYHRAGDARGESLALLLRAGELLEAGASMEVRMLYRRVRSLFARDGDHAGVIMCDAALELIEQLGTTRRFDSLHEVLWGCDLLQRRDDGSVAHSVPQRCEGGMLEGKPLDSASVNDSVLGPTRSVGETWSEDTFSYGPCALRTTMTVASDSECVTVPAGTFSGCRHVRAVTTDPGTCQGGSEQTRSQNRLLIGSRDVWLAAGVGIVKVCVDTGSTRTDPPVFALKEVTIEGASQEWLPLATGNRWAYVRQNLSEDGFVGVHTLQVRHHDADNGYYLSHVAYGYLVGAAAEAYAREQDAHGGTRVSQGA
jgi:RNA polymerase sigma-70 factor, ECF subfamily